MAVGELCDFRGVKQKHGSRGLAFLLRPASFDIETQLIFRIWTQADKIISMRVLATMTGLMVFFKAGQSLRFQFPWGAKTSRSDFSRRLRLRDNFPIFMCGLIDPTAHYFE